MSLTVAEYAQAKQLPSEFLQTLGVRDGDWLGTPSLLTPYLDQDGKAIAVRYRLSQNGGRRDYRWPRGTKAKGLVYGLDGWKHAAAKGWALVVEGESDVQTARLHDIPAFGIPGARLFDDDLTSPCLEGIGRLYVVQEPGEAGEAFAASLRGSRLADRLSVVSLGEHKDVSALHLAVAGDRGQFVAAIRAATLAAAPDEDDITATPRDDWYESAADLLAEGDPGPTPFLVQDLIVDGAIFALVGSPKFGKTWTLGDVSIAVAAGEKALGRFDVPTPGPVLLILEESGRAALHRRLDMLVRGRAIDPRRLDALYFAANKRVRLDDKDWKQRLLDVAHRRNDDGTPYWRLIAFDPLARIKGAVDEDRQREMGPVLDFLRDLREVSGAAVGYVHHTGHEGTRQRGSSDLEAYWESKLTLGKKDGGRTLQAEHREAEATGSFRLSFGFDSTTGTLRLRAFRGELEERVCAYLDEHPDASANEVDANVEGTRERILDLVREIREGGSEPPEPPRTTPSGSDLGGGSAVGAYMAPRTTFADRRTQVVRSDVSASSCDHAEQWLARDDRWRCATCEPPRFATEVVASRTAADLARDAQERGER